MINFPRKQSAVTIYHDNYTVEQVIKKFDNIKWIFPENSTSKNAFLAVCKVINSDKDTKVINSDCKYGGLIGPGKSGLHPFLQNFKLFRVHAAVHDAFVFMKTQYNLGPGYVSAFGEEPLFNNCCLLGHVTGLSVWTYLNLTMSENYKELPFWAKGFQMTAASSLLPSAVLHLSVDSKLYIQCNYHYEVRIYLKKFDYAVCSQNKNYKSGRLTPLRVDELLRLTKISKVLHSTLQYINYFSQQQHRLHDQQQSNS